MSVGILKQATKAGLNRETCAVSTPGYLWSRTKYVHNDPWFNLFVSEHFALQKCEDTAALHNLEPMDLGKDSIDLILQMTAVAWW